MTVASVGLLLALLSAEASPEAAAPAAFPTAYCAVADDISNRWTLQVNPVTQAHIDQAERLADAYPDADGITAGLHRTNIPLPWRHIEDVTLLSDEGVAHAATTSTGIVHAPGGGAFLFRLDRRPASADRQIGLAIDGHHELTTRSWTSLARPTPRISEARFEALGKPFAKYIRARRPRAGTPWLAARFVRWIEADLGGGIEALVITSGAEWSAIAAVNSAGALLDVPAGTEAPAGGAPGVVEHARFEAVAIVDLDGDGHDEVVVHEHWYEGRYTWLVRHDPTTKAIAVDLVCGDAA